MYSKRQEKAMLIFKEGYNCAQSVLCAFTDDVDLTEEQLSRVSSAFGGGFARSRGMCGAVSAMGMVIGLIAYNDSDNDSKKNIYELTSKLTNKFIDSFSTTNCGELLKNIPIYNEGTTPDERTAEYYKVRPCSMFVLKAVEILEKGLNLN